jgi:hypothetical protein
MVVAVAALQQLHEGLVLVLLIVVQGLLLRLPNVPSHASCHCCRARCSRHC